PLWPSPPPVRARSSPPNPVRSCPHLSYLNAVQHLHQLALDLVHVRQDALDILDHPLPGLPVLVSEVGNVGGDEDIVDPELEAGLQLQVLDQPRLLHQFQFEVAIAFCRGRESDVVNHHRLGAVLVLSLRHYASASCLGFGSNSSRMTSQKSRMRRTA